MLQRILMYNFLILTLDAFTYLFMNEKHNGYLKLDDYMKILKNSEYQKSFITKVFLVDILVIFCFIIFN